jgi:hypothetical protein
MVVLAFFSLVAGASVAAYVWFSSQPDAGIWRNALLLSLGLGILRTLSASAGEVILESRSDWPQIPAYMLALASLPEAALLPEALRSSDLVVGLGIFLGSGAWAFGIAWVATRRRRGQAAA